MPRDTVRRDKTITACETSTKDNNLGVIKQLLLVRHPLRIITNVIQMLIDEVHHSDYFKKLFPIVLVLYKHA